MRFLSPEGQNCVWCKIQHKPNPYPMCVFSTMIIVTSREHFRCAPNPLRFVSYLVFSKLSNCRNVVNIVEKFQWTRVSQGYSCVPRPLIASPELFLETTIQLFYILKSLKLLEKIIRLCVGRMRLLLFKPAPDRRGKTSKALRLGSCLWNSER